MSKKKTSFHRFNQQIDQEPTEVSTAVVVDTPKLETAVFKPEIHVEDASSVIEDIKPDTSSLKELFGELGQLLKQPLTEEPVNTNPYPSGPAPSERNANASDPTPPLPVPTDTVVAPVADDTVEDDEAKPKQVDEAITIQDLRDAADRIGTPPRKTTPEVTQQVTTEVPPTQVIVQAPTRTGWVFTIHRNKQTNLIERIEADPKP
jgi:hypothetical protein